MTLFAELKRRNVIRVSVAYLVAAWLLLQVGDVLIGLMGLPDWSLRLVLFLALLGFPLVVLFSWVYEMTPDGLRKESEIPRHQSVTAHTGKKLNVAIVLLLLLAIGLFVADRLVSGLAQPAAETLVRKRAEDIPVIAVLPLNALSTENEGLFLAAGLHDDLLTRLARLEAFRVISRTSVMEYAGTTKNLRQIGEELGAGFILEGGLQALGGRVRINAQLIDATTDEHLWAETFDRQLSTVNLFDVQAEIAAAIATALHATLSPDEVQTLQQVPTQNFDAYRAYLAGVATNYGLGNADMYASIESFERAVELDPTFPEAWGRLSVAYIRRYWEEGAELDAVPDAALRDMARGALEKAESLAPDGVVTLVAKGYYRYYGFRDYSGALAILEKAEALAPYDSEVIDLRGYLLRRQGRLNEAADALLRAREVDPNSAGLFREAIGTLVRADRCKEASDLTRLALPRHPSQPGVLQASALVAFYCDADPEFGLELMKKVELTSIFELRNAVRYFILTGEYRSAVDALEAAQNDWGNVPVNRLAIANLLVWLYRQTNQPELAETALKSALSINELNGTTATLEQALTAALRGDRDAALMLGRRALNSLPDDAWLRPVFRYQAALAYAQAGALDESIAELREMTRETGGHHITPMAGDPLLAPLYEHPGFAELVQWARK